MNTKEIAKGYRLSRWVQIVQERNESGLTVKAYCENAGIHVNSYYYWLKKLRIAACGKIAKVQGSTTDVAAPVFAEVEFPEQLKTPPTECAEQNHIYIEASGIRLTAGPEYPVDKLATLLSAVMHPCY